MVVVCRIGCALSLHRGTDPQPKDSRMGNTRESSQWKAHTPPGLLAHIQRDIWSLVRCQMRLYLCCTSLWSWLAVDLGFTVDVCVCVLELISWIITLCPAMVVSRWILCTRRTTSCTGRCRFTFRAFQPGDGQLCWFYFKYLPFHRQNRELSVSVVRPIFEFLSKFPGGKLRQENKNRLDVLRTRQEPVVRPRLMPCVKNGRWHQLLPPICGEKPCDWLKDSKLTFQFVSRGMIVVKSSVVIVEREILCRLSSLVVPCAGVVTRQARPSLHRDCRSVTVKSRV